MTEKEQMQKNIEELEGLEEEMQSYNNLKYIKNKT